MHIRVPLTLGLEEALADCRALAELDKHCELFMLWAPYTLRLAMAATIMGYFMECVLYHFI